MAAWQPLYTPSNCTFSGPLRWGVTIFWRASPPPSLPQTELAAALERDGVRLLGHRFCEPRVSQFALSTLAETTPLHVVSRSAAPSKLRRQKLCWRFSITWHSCTA